MVQLRAVLVAGSVQAAAAWWDEGHMLVARVSQEFVTDLNMVRLNRTLRTLPKDSIFGGFDDLMTSAVWMDQAKCRPKPGEDDPRDPYCEGLEEQPGLTVFFPWHISKQPYNPMNVDEKNLPLSARIGDQPVDPKTPTAITAIKHVQESFAKGPTSFDAWHLMLNTVLHAWGDVHQPLHTSDFFDDNIYKRGDAGGNSIRTTTYDMRNLHAVWDAAGGLYSKSMLRSKDNMHDLPRKMQDLIAEWPPEVFVEEGKLSPDWNNRRANYGIPRDASNVNFIINMIEDSRSLIPLVYEEFLLGDYIRNPNTRESPYTPSGHYLSQVRRYSKRQIALGGYRLSSWLNAYARYTPEPTGPGFVGITRPFSWLDWSSCLLVGCVGGAWGAFIVLASQQKKKRRREQPPGEKLLS